MFGSCFGVMRRTNRATWQEMWENMIFTKMVSGLILRLQKKAFLKRPMRNLKPIKNWGKVFSKPSITCFWI